MTSANEQQRWLPGSVCSRIPLFLFLCLSSIDSVVPFLLQQQQPLLESTGIPATAESTAIQQRQRRRVPRRQTEICLKQSHVDDEQDEDDSVDYGKFELESKMQHDDDDELPPLPKFLDEPDDAAVQSSSKQSSSLPSKQQHQQQDETQRRMEEQQRQIDMLLEMVQASRAQTPNEVALDTSSRDATTTTPSYSSSPVALAPLKAMLFIDGTWLYYSIHERQQNLCPIVQKYGLGWQKRYQVDWSALPRVICEQMQQQATLQGWSSSSSSSSSSATNDSTTATSTAQDQQQHGRPIEVVRALVFTSVKKETSKYSNRLKMYQDMASCNYDVHMMETVGPGEKCVDIQLAVEMLHYATVPNAYDVAILVSGDKDFLPAILRTRQKGRQVCLASMRVSCNRALFETPNVKDYDVVWIEDFLDQLMIPIAGDANSHKSVVSVFTLMKVIHDFIDKSGVEKVSSRDIGRYLKSIRIGDKSMLDEMKHSYGGIFQFLTVSGCFEVQKRQFQEEKASRKSDPNDKTFWVLLYPGAEALLLAEAKRTHFSPEEKEYFDSYSLEALEDDALYYHSRRQHKVHLERGDSSTSWNGADPPPPMELPAELTRDYSTFKAAELKEVCRERGLLVSGTKLVLMERIQSDVAREIEELKRQHDKVRIKAMKRPRISGRINGESVSRSRTNTQHQQPKKSVPAEAQKYLEGLVREYIQVSGGQASSRDLGRYLAASAPSNAGRQSEGTALTELKVLYGSLMSFITNHENVFAKVEDTSEHSTEYEFRVALHKS